VVTAMTPCHARSRTRRAGGFRGATVCGAARARGVEATSPLRRSHE
jgi:hypothetical protein